VRVAEGAPGCTGRLAALFADDSGASGWVPLVRFCLTELSDMCGVVSAASSSSSSGGGSSGGSSSAAAAGGVRWNVMRLKGGGGGGGGGRAGREEVLGEWYIRGRYYRLSWCLRALAGMTASSLSIDTFGVAQLSSPGLGDAAVGLLAAVVVLQGHVKAAAVSGGIMKGPGWGL